MARKGIKKEEREISTKAMRGRRRRRGWTRAGDADLEEGHWGEEEDGGGGGGGAGQEAAGSLQG